jgi:hypothetical protein
MQTIPRVPSEGGGLSILVDTLRARLHAASSRKARCKEGEENSTTNKYYDLHIRFDLTIGPAHGHLYDGSGRIFYYDYPVQWRKKLNCLKPICFNLPIIDF